jgi:hypothetical protein
MNGAIQPISWLEFPNECFYYFYFLAPFHAAVSVIGSIGMTIVPWRTRTSLLNRVGSFVAFLILLLLVGMVFSGIWSCTIWGRYYYSTDYVFDFVPVWPITQATIDARFGDETGRLMGLTLFQLKMIWLLFALTTWGMTFVLNRWFRGRFIRVPGIAPKAVRLLAIILLLEGLLTAVFVWNLWAPDRLYKYRYGSPPLIGGFLPPFTDTWEKLGFANPPGYYIWPAWAVYVVWLGFIAGAVGVACFVAWRMARDCRARRNQIPPCA